jgi:hypothetical protein
MSTLLLLPSTKTIVDNPRIFVEYFSYHLVIRSVFFGTSTPCYAPKCPLFEGMQKRAAPFTLDDTSQRAWWREARPNTDHGVCL